MLPKYPKPKRAYIRLNEPRPLGVRENISGRPAAAVSRYPTAIDSIMDMWRIDDEWWTRETISRLYYRVLLVDGRQLTIFKDLISGSWFSQSY
jgi:hypothetical protein